MSGGLGLSFGTMLVSGSLGISGSDIDSQYASVGAQSGLFAGDQGYDIQVGDHTQLNGAVIASTADPSDNQLSTGTLGWDDVQNSADYSATGYGFSSGVGGGSSPFALPSASAGQNGSAAGTSSSAIADGTLTIRDPDAQQQNVATLSHDTADANGHIDEIFDKEQVEQNLAFTQAVGQVGADAVQDVLQYQLSSAADAARAGLQLSDPNFSSLSPDAQQQEIEQTDVYKTAQSEYGIGGTYAILGDALSGALAGLAGGDLTQAAAGGLAPYLSQAVKAATTDSAGNVNVAENALGHALVGGLVAYLQGNSAVAGAVGGAGGELAAEAIRAELYPDTATADLTEEQKQTISALSTLAAGLAGTVAGTGAAGTATGAGAGKNAVDNNALSGNGQTETEEEKEEKEWTGEYDPENPVHIVRITPPVMAMVGVVGGIRSDDNFVGPMPLPPAQMAASWQGNEPYPGVDFYENVTLPAGTLVVGAVPGQSPYYTTLAVFQGTDGTAEGYYGVLQMRPNVDNTSYPPYRSGATIYQVGSDTNAASGTALANPVYGSGGGDQFFIPNYSNSLIPLYSIPFIKGP
ncbi:VENN motif pre-toxin domain-containing protein [Acerihabitans sp. KWT182]|uniref:VENN motif pre-toxin domain-containing protein n=1 Tax=Acerihabitans sp. KWT182 TaxID=3157919 RepID=A0AAU7QBX1_9GAMM